MTEETQLSQELHRRVADLPDPRLTFDDVRGRATRIRRQRAAAALSAAAVVAAIAVPTTLLSGGGAGDDSPPPAATPTQAVDLDGEMLPTLQDGVVIAPDVRIPLPLGNGDRADGFAPLGSSRYVVTVQAADGDRRVMLVDGQGRSQGNWPLAGGLAAASGASAVAWLAPDGTPLLLRAGADAAQPLSNRIGAGTSITAVTGDCATASGLCDLWIHIPGGVDPGSTRILSTAGSGSSAAARAPVPNVRDVAGDSGLIAGLDTEVEACGGVFDPSGGAFLWHHCRINVLDLSPNGGLIATAYDEGRGPTEVTIRDAHSGVPLTTVSADRISSIAWAGDDHLLVVEVEDDGSTHLERVGTEGQEIVLSGFHTSADGVPPIILPTVG